MRHISPIISFLVFFFATLSVSGESSTDGKTVKLDTENGEFMTLDECIAVTLQQNQTIENSYLNRIVQKSSLINSLNAYNPQGSIQIGPNWRQTIGVGAKSEGGSANVTTSLRQKMRTGGSLNFSWTKNATLTGKQAKRSTFSDSITLGFTQPLLAGAGLVIGSIPIEQAYLTEESNVLSLKITLMSQIQQLITKYRSYVTQIGQLKIQRVAFEQQKKRLEQQELQVEAGRLAKNDLLKAKAAIANSELSLVNLESTVDDARIDLLRFMNLPTTIPLLPVVEIEVPELDLPALDEALEVLYANDPSYLGLLISLRNSELSYKQAKDGLLWSMDLTGGLTGTSGNWNSYGTPTYEAARMANKSWSAGLSLTIPLNDRSKAHSYLSSKIALQQSRTGFKTSLDDIKADVTKRLRTIRNDYTSIQFAKQTTEFNRLDLEVAVIKFNAGMMTNFELVATQQNLVNAEVAELNAKITYLNDLVSLDFRLGTLLDTFGIDIDKRAAQSKRLRQQSGMPLPVVVK